MFPLLRTTPRYLAIVALGAASAGCSSETAVSPVGTSASALLGASVDPTHKFDVGICATDPGADPKAAPLVCTFNFCSGTLVAPNLVLTARHCVDEVNVADGWECAKTFANDVVAPSTLFVTTSDSASVSPAWRRVAEVRVPTESNKCADDVALLVLDEEVPASEATPIDVDLDTNLAARKPTAVAIVGRGAIDETFVPDDGYATLILDRGQRKRRVMENIPFVCVSDVDEECSVADYAGSPANELKLASSLFLIGPDSIGSGDSGSGIFDQVSFAAGKPKVIGVTTMGTSAEDGSLSGGVAVRASFQREFLVAGAQAAATKGGYPLPGWASGEDGSSPTGSAGDAGTASSEGAVPTTSASAEHDASGCETSSSPRRTPSGPALLAIVAGAVLAHRRRRLRR